MAIIQRNSDGFEILIQTLLNKERLAQEKEDLGLRKKDFALRQAESQAEQQRLKDLQTGMALAGQFFAQSGQIPGLQEFSQGMSEGQRASFTEGVIGFLQGGAQARQGIAGANVVEATQDAAITQTQAGAAQAASEARVAEATEGARIEVGQLQPELTRRQISESEARTSGLLADVDRIQAVTRGQNLNNAYQAMYNDLGAEFVPRINQARSLFESGQVTWGQARDAVGLPESAIPDDTVFVPAGGTQANAEMLKNQGFAQMMQVSDGIINALEGEGVRLAFLPSLQRQTQSPTFDAVVNLVAGTDQERLVNAQRMFGDAYRFSLSGQQSSDREALRMLNSLSSQVGDSPETIAQKRALREVMINVTRAKAGGGITGVQGAQMGLRAARNTGNPETIRLFEEILEQAVANSEGELISSTPTDPSNIVPRLDRTDELIERGLSGR